MNVLSKKELRDQYKNRICIGGVYCIKCHGNSKSWLGSATDLQGFKNRFSFSVMTNSCPELYMKEDWNEFGASSFTFEVLEEISKKDTQTAGEFAEDVATLLEMWNEKNNISIPGRENDAEQ